MARWKYKYLFCVFLLQVPGLSIVFANENIGYEAAKSGNYQKAYMEWASVAVIESEPVPLINIGTLYMFGRGVPHNYEKAYKWLHAAAIQAEKHENILNEIEKKKTSLVKYLPSSKIKSISAEARNWVAMLRDNKLSRALSIAIDKMEIISLEPVSKYGVSYVGCDQKTAHINKCSTFENQEKNKIPVLFCAEIFLESASWPCRKM